MNNLTTDCLATEIVDRIKTYLDEGKKVFTTSSFQTHSIPLLHIISRSGLDVPVYFLNSGYLFPESIKFKDEVAEMLGLNVINLSPLVPKNLQRDYFGNLYFTSDPDYCCYLNKVQPLESILQSKDIWINGIRSDQNSNRKAMKEEENAPYNVIRYHPMLHWTKKMIYEYIHLHDLPKHPFDAKTYHSIGCEPCTRLIEDEDKSNREGRWFGLKKVECGLHTELVKK